MYLLPGKPAIEETTVRRFLLIAIFAIVCLFIFSIYHRAVYIDDAWSAEQAFQLTKYGYVRSEIFQGLLNYETKILDSHKLHILQGAILIKLFGFSPYLIKALPIPYILLLIYMYYRYSTRMHIFSYSYSFPLLVLLVITHAFVFEYAYIYRPDIIQGSLGFTSFYFLQKSYLSHKMQYVATAALIAGIGVLIHLNGIVFVAAGGLLLLTSKNIKGLFLFGIITGLISLFYFFDICCTYENVELYLYQLKNNPALQKSNFSIWTYFSKVLDEHMRLFRTPREASLSICFFIVIILFFKTFGQKYPALLYYTLFLIFSVALITRDINGQYYMLYLPFLAIVVAIGFEQIINKKYPAYTQTALIFLAAYFVLHLILIVKVISRRNDIIAINQEIVSNIPKNAKVMSSILLVFNELENYDLQIVEAYAFNKKKNLIPASDTFFDFCKNHNREYIAVDEKDVDKLDMSLQELIRGNDFYTFVARKNNYIILKYSQ